MGKIDQLWVIVENDGCLAVKPKAIKLTYAKTVRMKATVEVQNRLIMNNGLNPTNDLDETYDLNKVDIKKKQSRFWIIYSID